MKFGVDRMAEFKKSFKHYRQILVRFVTKVAKNFIKFCMAWTKVSEIQQIFNKIFKPD